MANAQQKSNTAKTPCPLFPEAEPPVYAEDIKEVRVYYVTRDRGGREQRKLLPRAQHRLEIDFYDTTDQDFVDNYPPGTYFVEPISLEKSHRMGGGHNIVVPDPAEFEAEDGDEDDVPVLPERPAPASPLGDASVMALLKDFLKDKERAAHEQLQMMREHSEQRAGMYENFAATMMKDAVEARRADAPNGDVVAVLREQLEEVRRKAREAEDELRKTYRDDLAKRDRDVEELRRTHRDDLAKRDRELDDLRGDFRKREEELRRRGTQDEDEVRRKWREEVADARTKHDREVNDLRATLAETRVHAQKEIDRIQKEIYDLRKENIDLTKELAAVPDEPQAPPSGAGGVGVPSDAPPWMQTAAAIGQMASTPIGAKIMETGAKVVDRVASALAEDPRRSVAPQPQFVPPAPQQFAPPPQQLGSASAPDPQPVAPRHVPRPEPTPRPPAPVASASAVRPFSFVEEAPPVEEVRPKDPASARTDHDASDEASA